MVVLGRDPLNRAMNVVMPKILEKIVGGTRHHEFRICFIGSLFDWLLRSLLSFNCWPYKSFKTPVPKRRSRPMCHPDDIFESARTTKIEIAIKKIFCIVEVLKFLMSINPLMIYKSCI